MSIVKKTRKNLAKIKLHLSKIFKKAKFPLANRNDLITLMDGHAYIHDDEIKLFSSMAKETSGPIVEIGCAFGASPSIFLLHSKPGVRLHSIDPFVQDSMKDFQANEKICRKNVKNILNFYNKDEKYADWNLHVDFSYNLVKKWPEIEAKPIEILFIDGDHNYEAVKKDFDDWFPLVKNGGYILFHDSRKELGTPIDAFNRGWVGPTKLANELNNLDKVKLSNEAFSITVWQKII